MSKFKFLKNKKQQDKQQPKQAKAATQPEQLASESPPDAPESRDDAITKNRAFAFLQDKAKNETTPPLNTNNPQTETPQTETPAKSEAQKKKSITPGSTGEHKIQERLGTKDRAHNFYDKQVLDYLAPKMKEFIARQEFLFISTADRNGECDCTSKFGVPGFIHVLSDKYLIYPEFRGNGVFANSGNVTENPHIGMLIIDFTRDTVGLHINGKARLVENHELMEHSENLPETVIDLINQEGKKCPERWMMVEVQEAYIQCSKHIPLMQKKNKKIDWGTDNIAAKGGDYFQLMDIPLYDRVGGDKAMEIAVDLFYRKVLNDDLVSAFFEDIDMQSQRLKQKSFLSMAFGGPYQYSDTDLRNAHHPLIKKLGLNDQHFDRVSSIFQATLEELNISEKEINAMMDIIESTRDDILNR